MPVAVVVTMRVGPKALEEYPFLYFPAVPTEVLRPMPISLKPWAAIFSGSYRLLRIPVKSNLVARHIDREEAEQILREALATAPGSFGRSVVMGVYYDKELGERMLLRIVVEEAEEGSVVFVVRTATRSLSKMIFS